VDQTQKIYDKTNAKVEKEKSELFEKGFSDKWQLLKQSNFEPDRATDREHAMQYILPEQTNKVENLHDELEYFTEQMYREISRIVNDNTQVQMLSL
jgi:chromatin segregation and condensation protein Rec8/ScpA/Scc1 (kleisin family)